jgi:hypothetical protein
MWLSFVSDLWQVGGFLWVHNIMWLSFVSDLWQVGGFFLHQQS